MIRRTVQWFIRLKERIEDFLTAPAFDALEEYRKFDKGDQYED